MKGVFLLLAGMLNDERVWAPVAQRLRAQSGWAVEALGFPTENSMQAMAASALQRLQAHGDAPVVLAGFSMGGYVAQQLLAQGLKVRALALVDSAVRPETEATLAGRQKAAQAMEKDFALFAAQVARYSTAGASQDLQPQVAQSLQDVGLQAGLRHLQAIAGRADHRALLAALDIPVSVVCGREDKVTPPEMSQEAADLIPGARLRWVEGAGHMVPLEQPDLLADELMQLAARAGLLTTSV